LSSESPLDCQPDAALIARYVAVRDEEAFRELMRRHGPMVLGTCARVLRHCQDTEDAFQAVFIILAARSRALRRVRSLGGWLHNVAVRVSYGVLRGNRRRTRRLFATHRERPPQEESERVRELQDVLDEELTALPAKYRQAIVLCDLEGHTREEAARILNTSAGTVATWVARGRRRLRERLVRRGVTLGAGGLAAAVAQWAASAPQITTQLVQQTLAHTELFLLTGTKVTGTAAAAKITSLAQGELHNMFLTKLSTTVGIAALAVALLFGASPASQILGLAPSLYAAQIFLDDFEDGSITDGNPVTWATNANFPFTSLNVLEGNLRIGVSALGNYYNPVSVPALPLGNTSIRAQVRIESQYDEAAAVFVRGDLDNITAHALEIEADGTVWFGILGSGQLQSIETSLRPTQEDVLLQLDAIGDTISGWAWRAGEPRPAIPTFSRINTAIPNGVTGVYYAPALNPRNPLGTAIFRFVHVADTTIPEPATGVLGSLGFLALGSFAFRRRLLRF
jgi:RNA polymerase sigma factor (sigma-70 family)